MDNGNNGIRGGEPERLEQPVQPGQSEQLEQLEQLRQLQQPGRRDRPASSNDGVRPQRAPAPALTRVDSDTFSMDQLARFFNPTVAPQGNALVGDMIDENGPLPGREGARGKRRPGSLPTQFIDVDRPVLFAPNDAPDELTQRQSDLDRLLREQAFRGRRNFTA